jgi:hypothetical protein
MRKTNLRIAGLALVAVLGVAPAAQAATSGDQMVAGTTAGSLGLTVSTPVVTLGTGIGSNTFTPGATPTGLGTVAVVATGPWNLSVQDTTGASTNKGHLKAAAAGCSGSTSYLSNPLSFSAAPALGTNTGYTGTLSGSSTPAGSGTLSDDLTVSYTEPIPSSERLLLGCAYSVTATFTVS